VRRPPRVADAAFNGSVCWLGGSDLFLENANPADRPDDLGLALIDDCDTARIVPAIFEPLQSTNTLDTSRLPIYPTIPHILPPVPLAADDLKHTGEAACE
jgi:hypothetical protein